MIERAYIHVAGPARSGKTTLIEAIVAAFDGPAITAGCRRNDDLAESVEAAPVPDADLPLPTPMPAGAEWIEAYRLWLGGR